MINKDGFNRDISGSAVRFGFWQKLLLALTPVIVAVSGLVAFLLSGWNSAQIAPLRQWAAEREGKEIYSRLIHEGPLSPGDLLQKPSELAMLVKSDSEVQAAALMQGNSILASYSRDAGFVFPLEVLPLDTGAIVLDDRNSAYRRFFGPGGSGDAAGHPGGGRGSGSGRGPRWMHPENSVNSSVNFDSRQDRFNLVFVFNSSNSELVRPLVYQKWLWPMVWLVLTLLWGVVIIMQRRMIRFQLQMQKESSLAAIGEMSARLAHEIRNPLGAIRGISQFLYKKMADSDERNMVQTIEQETFRLDSLTGSILDFSRPPQCQIVMKKIEESVMAAVELFKSKHPKLTIHCDFSDADHLIAMLDENGVRQIMLNLLSNAADASLPEGLVKVEIRQSASKIFVRVINEGDPMSEKQLEEIFEPFVSSKTRGYGLGLPISLKLAESMGGQLRLYNGPDKTIIAELILNRPEEK